MVARNFQKIKINIQPKISLWFYNIVNILKSRTCSSLFTCYIYMMYFMDRPPLDVSRDNFAEIFLRAASFHDFFLSSFAQLLALFSEKSGVRFESYATLCNQASAQNSKIFWICVQNIWKMAFCAKTPF